jgi:ArsR family transcriptional regulator
MNIDLREAPFALDFTQGTKYFKALSDETRIRILHILSCGELCGCEILEYFSISQPTLSHHLALLTEAGLVSARREGKWMYYTVHRATAEHAIEILQRVVLPNAECECQKLPNKSSNKECCP